MSLNRTEPWKREPQDQDPDPFRRVTSEPGWYDPRSKPCDCPGEKERVEYAIGYSDSYYGLYRCQKCNKHYSVFVEG